MAREILITSVPRGIKPGRSGFQIAMQTAGLRQDVGAALEMMAGYRHLAAGSGSNPVCLFHRLARTVAGTFHVLGRTIDAGVDFSNRSNKLCHMVVLDPAELSLVGNASPAGVLTAIEGRLAATWTSGPEERQTPFSLAGIPKVSPAPCGTWLQRAGDPGWAGVFAERANQNQPTMLIGRDPSPASCREMLRLFQEALAIMPPAKRWGVTFDTLSLSSDGLVWRGTYAGSPESATRQPGLLVLDLSRPQPIPAEYSNRSLVQAARTGRPEWAAGPIVPAASARPTQHGMPQLPTQPTPPAPPTASICDGIQTPPTQQLTSPPPSRIGVGEYTEQTHSANDSGKNPVLIVALLLGVLLALAGGGTAAYLVLRYGPIEPGSSTEVAQNAPQESDDSQQLEKANADDPIESIDPLKKLAAFSGKGENPLTLRDWERISDLVKADVKVQENWVPLLNDVVRTEERFHIRDSQKEGQTEALKQLLKDSDYLSKGLVDEHVEETLKRLGINVHWPSEPNRPAARKIMKDFAEQQGNKRWLLREKANLQKWVDTATHLMAYINATDDDARDVAGFSEDEFRVLFRHLPGIGRELKQDFNEFKSAIINTRELAAAGEQIRLFDLEKLVTADSPQAVFNRWREATKPSYELRTVDGWTWPAETGSKHMVVMFKPPMPDPDSVEVRPPCNARNAEVIRNLEGQTYMFLQGELQISEKGVVVLGGWPEAPHGVPLAIAIKGKTSEYVWWQLAPAKTLAFPVTPKKPLGKVLDGEQHISLAIPEIPESSVARPGRVRVKLSVDRDQLQKLFPKLTLDACDESHFLLRWKTEFPGYGEAVLLQEFSVRFNEQTRQLDVQSQGPPWDRDRLRWAPLTKLKKDTILLGGPVLQRNTTESTGEADACWRPTFDGKQGSWDDVVKLIAEREPLRLPEEFLKRKLSNGSLRDISSDEFAARVLDVWDPTYIPEQGEKDPKSVPHWRGVAETHLFKTVFQPRYAKEKPRPTKPDSDKPQQKPDPSRFNQDGQGVLSKVEQEKFDAANDLWCRWVAYEAWSEELDKNWLQHRRDISFLEDIRDDESISPEDRIAATFLLALDAMLIAKLEEDEIRSSLASIPLSALFSVEFTAEWEFDGLERPIETNIVVINPSPFPQAVGK